MSWENLLMPYIINKHIEHRSAYTSTKSDHIIVDPRSLISIFIVLPR